MHDVQLALSLDIYQIQLVKYNRRECSTIMCRGYKNQGGALIFVTPVRGGACSDFLSLELGRGGCLTKLTKVA